MSSDSAANQSIQRVFGEVEAAPYRHDFYAVMRLLETLDRTRPRWGRAQRPRDEAVRVGQDPELDFAPAAISSFLRRESGPPRLGPMPLHLTEYARERAHNHADFTLSRFADQFHHRAGLLFYRAWAMSQPVVHLDRRADDAFSRWIGALGGIGEPTQSGRDSLSDEAKRHRVAILACGAKTAEGLTKLLRGWFGIAVRLKSHVGHWLAMRPADRTRLLPPTRPVLRNVLGSSAVAGAKVWDRQFRFRLHLGPMDYATYQRFLPGQRSIVELRDWVRQYVGLSLSFDAVAWLRGSEVPPLALGVQHANDGRLGWTTWLGSRRALGDRGDLRVSPEAPRCINVQAE
jgi:type VI secretion system protein ImpH